MLSITVRLNKKTASSKLGAKLKEAETALTAMDGLPVADALRQYGKFTLAGVDLDASDYVIEYTAPAGWCGANGVGLQVMVNTTVTEELKLEGLARDVIRQVQNARKEAKLDLLDKIALHLAADSPELAKAIQTHRQAVATAVQATHWSEMPLSGDGVHSATVKIDGQPLTITLRKV